jgi:hypothetical protein
MKLLRSKTRRIHLGLSLAVGTLSVCLLSGTLRAGEEPRPKQDFPSSKRSAPTPKPGEKKPPKKLSGAELYALHCNRCHPERYAPERTPEQWKTILLHMRTRANLPAEQARAILRFLQEDSGK